MWLMTMLVPYCLSHSPLGLATDDAASLRDEHQSLTQQLNHNQFQRPLYLTSAESSSTQRCDIYAVVDCPFAIVNSALNYPALGPANWCNMLILCLYTKYCRAPTGSNGSVLRVNIGKTVEEDLEPYLAAITSQLDAPAREVLASIEGAGRASCINLGRRRRDQTVCVYLVNQDACVTIHFWVLTHIKHVSLPSCTTGKTAIGVPAHCTGSGSWS